MLIDKINLSLFKQLKEDFAKLTLLILNIFMIEDQIRIEIRLRHIFNFYFILSIFNTIKYLEDIN